MNSPAPFLRLSGIAKSFGGVTALAGVDFELAAGEIVGLIGDNGAGKSTLVKILSGVYAPDAGSLTLDGKPVDFRSYDVRRARALGIEAVHQDRCLGEKQPLWRNLFVGRHRAGRLGFIDIAREKTEAMTVLRDLVGLSGNGLSPEARVAGLSGGERQGLAIGRAMHFHARVVILDEPTTALSLREVERVLSFIADLKAQRRAAVFVSHTLSHVHAVADRFVILERGRVAAMRVKDNVDLSGLCSLVQAPGAA